MLDILDYLPAKRKVSPSGWTSFNAVCCHHNGDSPDRRSRGGIKTNEQGWSYHCFNCGYTASFIIGRTISYKARKLLTWLGVPEREIDLINLESLKHRSIHGLLEDRQATDTAVRGIEFEELELPPGAEFLTPDFAVQWEYLKNRCVLSDFPFMIQAQSKRPGVIVPFTYNNKIVGSTIRFLDNHNPRYLNNMQPGYVFGTDLLHNNWTHVIVTEGIFDALSIGGLALMHNTVSDAQAKLIRRLGKEVTVVPDQDAAGIELIDRAVELNWAVSIPNWEDCKDVNDAVKKYGRLGTLITIMQARETSKIKIELRKKQLVKRLRN